MLCLCCSFLPTHCQESWCYVQLAQHWSSIMTLCRVGWDMLSVYRLQWLKLWQKYLSLSSDLKKTYLLLTKFWESCKNINKLQKKGLYWVQSQSKVECWSWEPQLGCTVQYCAVLWCTVQYCSSPACARAQYHTGGDITLTVCAVTVEQHRGTRGQDDHPGPQQQPQRARHSAAGENTIQCIIHTPFWCIEWCLIFALIAILLLFYWEV